VKATTICGSSEPWPSRDVSRDDCEGDQADRARTFTCVADGSTCARRFAATALGVRSTRSCAWIAVVEAHHPALRSASHSSMKAENWFQLCIVGVTKKTRDSDSGRSPLVRCGKYVSRACTLDLAPVQVRDTFGVLLNRASLEVPLGRHQGRLASELRAHQCRVAWLETQPWLCASSASGSGPSPTLSTGF
jgi:hypothetical protein